MKKTFKKTSAFVFAMAVMAAPMTFSSFVANADGETVTSDYTLTIPATLNVENVGWNSIGNISATGTLESGKKLTVTAASTNSWALKSGENSVSYTLNNGSDTKGDAATSWDFTSLPASQAIGIDVSDYSEKPAGTYTDTVTFTASVESAAKKLTLTGSYDVYSTDERVTKSLEIEYTDNDTWKDIVERYDEVSTWDYGNAPEGKIIYFWKDDDAEGCQLKSNESTYNYKLVSINDKVSAYSSYYLGH